jgi:hypothetical protein
MPPEPINSPRRPRLRRLGQLNAPSVPGAIAEQLCSADRFGVQRWS